jgi:intermediate cleaving peptidase 55
VQGTSMLLLLPKISLVSRTGLPEVPAIFRTDDALSIDQFSTHLKSIIPSYSKIYVDVPPTHTRRGPRSVTKSILNYLSPPAAPRSEYDILVDSITAKRQPLAPLVAKLRAFKSEAEQRVMRAAADISGRAHAKVRSRMPCKSSVDIDCTSVCDLRGPESRKPLLLHTLNTSARYLVPSDWRMFLSLPQGRFCHVYSAGVDAGPLIRPNALIIHYTSNNHLIRTDETILIDAGCEYKYAPQSLLRCWYL